jgi:vacuolar-type H+-ATPase subunit E/Vma4
MGRFERDEIEARRLPTSLGSATDDLRTTIEAEVAKIVEQAESRAADIESQALDRASRMQQDSERRAREVFHDSRDRLQQMLAEIDAIDRVVSDAIRSLRAETERLTSEIDGARQEPFHAAEPIQPSDIIDGALAAPAEEELQEVQPDELPSDEPAELPVDESAATAEPDSEQPSSDGADPEADPEVREMIRQQLVSLAEGGRNRADAERMLLRFRQGEQYFDLLDEIYPEEAQGRRGLLRRRKAR